MAVEEYGVICFYFEVKEKEQLRKLLIDKLQDNIKITYLKINEIETDLKILMDNEYNCIFILSTANYGIELLSSINIHYPDLKIPIVFIGHKISSDYKIKLIRFDVDLILDLDIINENEIQNLKDIITKKLVMDFSEPKGNWYNFTINSKRIFSHQVADYLGKLASKTPFEESEIEEIQFVLRELQDNAIEHGNKYDELKKVNISSVILDDCIIIKIQDEGEGFDFASLIDPMQNLDESIEERKKLGKRPGGWGIAIARRVMDRVEFSEKGNMVIMTKYFNEN